MEASIASASAVAPPGRPLVPRGGQFFPGGAGLLEGLPSGCLAPHLGDLVADALLSVSSALRNADAASPVARVWRRSAVGASSSKFRFFPCCRRPTRGSPASELQIVPCFFSQSASSREQGFESCRTQAPFAKPDSGSNRNFTMVFGGFFVSNFRHLWTRFADPPGSRRVSAIPISPTPRPAVLSTSARALSAWPLNRPSD